MERDSNDVDIEIVFVTDNEHARKVSSEQAKLLI